MARAFKAGEIKGFNFFFDRYYRSLLYFSTRLTGSPELSEELVDEAFIKTWERRSSFHSAAAIKAFLYRVVRNASLDGLRRQKTRMAVYAAAAYLEEAIAPPVEEALIRAETLRKVEARLSRLPQQCRRVFELFFLQGKDYAAIALELHTTINNVRNHKARALKLLRQQAGLFLLLSLFVHLLLLF